MSLHSLPTKLLLTILSLLLVFVGIFYFLNKTPQTAEAWYSSSYEHRRPISVSNSSGGSLTNADVLITLDTASLISAGKMQADCDDLRLVDSDDTTLLSYWIEAGCNTSTTQIWARIPSLLSVGETIFAYYDNSAATNGEAAWTGNFQVLSTITCPAGWTRNGTLDNRIPYGNTTYGSTGGSDSYTPAAEVRATGAASAGVIYRSGGGGTIYTSTHTHNITMTLAGASILPPYVGMFFCYSPQLNLYTNAVTLYTTTPSTNRTRFSTLDNRFPRGASSYGAIGAGTTHFHSYSASVSNEIGSTVGYDTGFGNYNPVGIARRPHNHTVSGGNTSGANNLPPYISSIFAQITTPTVADQYTIVMANAVPPLGWTENTSYNGRFPRGATTYGTTGGSSTHTHSIGSITTGGPSNIQNPVDGGSGSVGSYTHTHTKVAHTTAAHSSIPAYFTTKFISRKSSQTTTLIAEEMYNQLPNAPSNLKTEGLTNPTAVSDLTPEFQATFTDPDAGDTGVYYQIQVNTSSAFTGTVMWDSTKTAMTAVGNGSTTPQISYAGSALSHSGTTYYWRMKVWDQATGESAWSSTAQFTMNSSPSATNLKAEGATNPSGVTDLTPEFQATFTDPNATDTGVYYQIQVNTTSAFNGTTMWDSTKTAMTAVGNGSTTPQISYAGTPLSLNATTYYWRIKVWDQVGGESAWSSTAQFTMNAPPSAPSTPYCEGATNPSSVTDATPEFSAIHSDPDSNPANYYQIQVNTNNTFTGTVMWDSTKTSIANITSGTRSPDISYAGSSLTFTGVTYYWRIKFWDTNNLESPWSAVQQFTTATASAFSAPINCLIQKSNVNDYLNVVWSDTASNEDGFQIERSLNGGAWTTLDGSLAANTTSYLDNSVSSGNTYQYRVNSYFPGPIYSNWCNTPTLDIDLGNIKFEDIQFY